MIGKNVISIGIFTIPLLLIALVEGSAPGVQTGVGPLPKKHIVEIAAFKYIPDNLDVNVGDTVVWINNDVVPHTATDKNKMWDTDFIGDSKKSKYVVIENSGKQEYLCLYHPTMRGTITAK